MIPRARRTIPSGSATGVERAAVLAVALLMVALFRPRVPGFSTDSDAYLDVARNLLDGAGLVQRVVDFWRPSAPDPLGLWPPLYPLATALAARLGSEVANGARLVSTLSFLIFAQAFLVLARRALGAGAALVVTTIVLCTAEVARAATMAWSEMLFLALTTCALAGLATLAPPDSAAEAETSPGSGAGARMALASAAGLAAGLAAVTRYVGIWLPGFGIGLLLLARAPARLLAAWSLPALLLPALWLIRNVQIFGHPWGPGLPPSTLGPLSIAHGAFAGLRWGLLPLPVARLPLGSAIALALLGIAVVLAIRRRDVPGIAAAFSLVYLAVLVAARTRSTFNEIGGRYLVPVYPFLWLAAAGTVSREVGRRPVLRRVARWVALATVLISVAGLVLVLRSSPAPAPEALERDRELAELAILLRGNQGPVLSDAGHRLRLATGNTTIQVPPVAFRGRDLTAADAARWRAFGMREAVFRRRDSGEAANGDPMTPAHREGLGTFLAARLDPTLPGAWSVIDTSRSFVRYLIP